MNTLYNEKETCTSQRRCKKYRICDYCNNIRQAQISDITEIASRFSPIATYAVVMPIGKAQLQETVKAVKSRITRKLKKSVDGTFISVETSANDALHLNILMLSQEPIITTGIKKVIKNLDIRADIFSEQIPKGDIRKITSYALKKQSIPTKDQYSGNNYNLTGTVKNAKSIMQSEKMFKYAPSVAIVAMCNTLQEWGIEPPSDKLLQFKSMQSITESLVTLVNQIDTQEICYSPKHGLLNKNDFIKLYKTRMKSIKSLMTREENKQKAIDMRALGRNAKGLTRQQVINERWDREKHKYGH